MSIVDLETLPPDDRAAIQAMVEAAYRKAPELRVKLNDEAPTNAAHWSKVAAEALALLPLNAAHQRSPTAPAEQTMENHDDR